MADIELMTSKHVKDIEDKLSMINLSTVNVEDLQFLKGKGEVKGACVILWMRVNAGTDLEIPGLNPIVLEEMQEYLDRKPFNLLLPLYCPKGFRSDDTSHRVLYMLV